MPTRTSTINQAREKLASIKLNQGITEDNVCTFNFENTDPQKRNKHLRFATLCPDGTIRCEWVSFGPFKSINFHAGNIFVWTGILLQYVSSLGLNAEKPDLKEEAKIIEALEKSSLVSALREAMAEGKFAPIMSSSK